MGVDPATGDEYAGPAASPLIAASLAIDPMKILTATVPGCRLLLVFLATFALTMLSLPAQSDLRDALKDDVGDHWIYDDYPAAVTRAKQTGRPLLVLFRCVP